MNIIFNKITIHRDINLIDIFFKNISYKQTILKNTFWITLAQISAGIINFFLIIYIIRKFGPTEYGKFAFALSFVSLFSTFFDFGLSTTVLREFARDKEKEKYFSNVLILKVFLGIVILFVILVISLFITPNKLILRLIIILGFYIFTLEMANLFYSMFRAQQKMQIEAIFRILHILILSSGVLGVIFLKPTVLNLSYAYAGANLTILIIIFIFCIFRNDNNSLLSFSSNKSIWKEFLMIGLYIALAKGFGDITMNTDAVMLGYWGQITEIGWYKAASKIIGMALFPMAMVASAIFPALIAILNESKEKFLKYWESWRKGTVFLSIFLCFIVLAKADKIIEIAYSPDFFPAALALKILIIMAAIGYINILYFHILLIFDQQKRIFLVMLSAAIVNIILNLILIPKFSFYGACVATVITHFIILCQYFIFVSKYTIVKPFNSEFFFTLSIAITSGILMYLSLSLMDTINANLFVSILGGVLVYLLSFMSLNKIVKSRFS